MYSGDYFVIDSVEPGMAPKSDVWKYFSKQTGHVAVCKFCGKHIKTSGNTSNLKAHFVRHSKEIQNRSKGDQNENRTDINSDNSVEPVNKRDRIDGYFTTKDTPTAADLPSRAITASSSSASTYEESINGSFCSTSSIVSTNQPKINQAFQTLAHYEEGGKKHCRISNALVYFICKDNMPFSIVEGTGFQKFIKEISPLYKIPSRNSIKSRILSKYEVISNLFKEKLHNINNVTITTDIWTETMQMKSFLGLTAHFLDKTSLVSTCLDVVELSESHTGEYISDGLQKVLEDWNISKNNITAVVTDNDAKMIKAIDIFVGKSKHLSCFAHTLNLTVDNAMKYSGINELITKIRNIVKFIKASTNASDAMRKEQLQFGLPEGNVKKVILDVSTRWNSTFYMCERFLELLTIINNILINRPNSPPMLTAAEVNLTKEVLGILQIPEKLTKEVSGEQYVTVSTIIPLINCAIQNLSSVETHLPIAFSLKESLLKEIEKRFGAREQVNILAMATYLDPRFKNVHFNNPVASSKILLKINQTVLEYMKTDNLNLSENVQHDTIQTKESKAIDIWSFHKNLTQKQHMKSKQINLDSDTITPEIRMYLSAPLSNLKENPLVIWEELKFVYPNLYLLARIYLSIVGTSVPSERLFSLASNTITQTRNRLSGKLLPKLLFLHSMPDEYWSDL